MHAVKLTKGLVAIVDDADIALVSRYRWYATRNPRQGKTWYAAHRSRVDGKNVSLFMHRLIANPPDGLDVDHRNGNGLDNRQENLRICSRGRNIASAKRKAPLSGFRGVSRSSNSQSFPWIARIHVDGRKLYLGKFPSKEDAARAYDAAARRYFGEFATLNFTAGEAA